MRVYNSLNSHTTATNKTEYCMENFNWLRKVFLTQNHQDNISHRSWCATCVRWALSQTSTQQRMPLHSSHDASVYVWLFIFSIWKFNLSAVCLTCASTEFEAKFKSQVKGKENEIKTQTKQSNKKLVLSGGLFFNSS